MWVIVLFDLPVDTPESRSAYTVFRTGLLKNGYIQLQYSVYARHCANEENASTHATRVRHSLPPDGEIRILRLTDKQFGRMEIFHGEIRGQTENAPKQISFF